ncbi:MAG: hypothetical protein LBH53_01610, partial [Puniceicoccales bacterium]|nr:hypothetical protein [Puniceicoccales bacterium]
MIFLSALARAESTASLCDGPIFGIARALCIGNWAIADSVERSLPGGEERAFLSIFGGEIRTKKAFLKNRHAPKSKYKFSVKADKTAAYGSLVGKTCDLSPPYSFSLTFGAGRSYCKRIDLSRSRSSKGRANLCVANPTASLINARQTCALAALSLRKEWMNRKTLGRDLSISLIGQLGMLSVRPNILKPTSNSTGCTFSPPPFDHSFLLPCNFAHGTVNGGLDLCRAGGFRVGPFCSLSADRFEVSCGLPLVQMGFSYRQGNVAAGLRYRLLRFAQRFQTSGHVGYRLPLYASASISTAGSSAISRFEKKRIPPSKKGALATFCNAKKRIGAT